MASPPRSEHFSKPTFPWRFGLGGGPATGRLPRHKQQAGRRRRDAKPAAPRRNHRAEEGHAKKWHGQAWQCHQGTRATSSLDVRPFKPENSRYVNIMSIFCNMYGHHPAHQAGFWVVPPPASLALASSRLDSASIADWKINKKREKGLCLRGKLPSTATSGSENSAAAETVPLDLCRAAARKSSLCSQEAKGLFETWRRASDANSGQPRHTQSPKNEGANTRPVQQDATYLEYSEKGQCFTNN